jgi:hypothetical protein
MDKIRNIMYAFTYLNSRSPMSIANSRPKNSSGSKKEEEGTYDPDSYSQTATHHSIAGKLTGEGSHLNSATGNTGTYLS